MNGIKRVFSALLCVLLFTGTFILPGANVFSGVNVSAKTAGGNYYMINGVPLSYNSVDDPGLRCDHEYASLLYNKVWGVGYTDDFASSDNIIKNYSSHDRALTPENLAKFVSMSAPGTVIRICNSGSSNDNAPNGFSFFIVKIDANGFFVFERTDSIKEVYYTWGQFCSIYTYSHIKYLKWPNSYFTSENTENETDYKKPKRTLYYDNVEMLFGDDVRWVQQKLNDAGYPVAIDGYYSKKTEAAISEFQNDFSISSNGIVDSVTSNMLENPMKKPEPPTLSLSAGVDFSIGELATVKWDAVSYAEYYDVMVYNSRGKKVDELLSLKATQASFVMNQSGSYTVKATAYNENFQSDVALLDKKIKVHNTVTVTFVDDDGTVLNKQTIAYGKDATTPASPKKKGYSFNGWDARYLNVTSSIIVTAQYTKKSYDVVFLHKDSSVLDRQRVLYGEAAVEPDTSTIDRFICWNKDFSYIESNITVKPVVIEKDDFLSVSISEATATREEESSGYSVYFTVTNNTANKLVGRAVVALKTTAGKFLTMTESSAFTLSASNISKSSYMNKRIKVFVPYDKAATLVEVYVVEDYSDLVPISAVLQITEINSDNDYTDWLTETEAPKAYYSVTAPRTEYRYRTKSYKTSSAPTLSGWTRYHKAITSYSYGGWSVWGESPITPTADRDVRTKTETYVTGYNCSYWRTQSASSPYYRHYWNYNHGPERKSYGQYHYDLHISLSNWDGMPVVAPGGLSSGVAAGYNRAGVGGRMAGNGDIWFRMSDVTASRTYYQFQDRYPVYTYYYYKWSSWSDWSATSVGANGDREVETRQTRRYLVNDPTECNEGKARTVAGVFSKNTQGKQATLFIYKKGDASDYTNEYIGQTVLGENGAYQFSFKLREEPSVETGDLYMVMGIEGANTVVFLDTIEAPLPRYTVNICDYDGTILDTQQVSRGNSAVLPINNPVRLGYTFAGWNYSNASIYEDTNISALYVQDEYTVVFIDWTNEIPIMQTGYHYGEPLLTPGLEGDAKYDAVCWKNVIDSMTVTENMVITALYEKKAYTVEFYDFDRNIINEQTVEYGKSAEIPTLDSTEDCLFLSWHSFSELDSVSSDMEVYPNFCYAKTTEKPFATLSSGVFNGTKRVELQCGTENAVIYYSINGEEEQIYTSPLSIVDTSEIYFYAASIGYNISETSHAYYVINRASDETNWKYPITIYDGTTAIDTRIVSTGSKLANNLINTARNGYSFSGFYKDQLFEELWNFESDTINASTNLFAKWNANQYTVTFAYEDGTIIDTQSVVYLGAATAPVSVAVGDGMTFVRWSTDNYSCVTGELTVTAVIVPTDEVATLILSESKMNMMSGLNFTLSATVTPEQYSNHTILWTSSNPQVASVDVNGTIKAGIPGTAVIRVTISDMSYVYDECTITVVRNPSEELCLNDDADLTISDKYIFGVFPGKNSVGDIVSNFTSTSISIYAEDGTKLEYSDTVPTGATICLFDNADTLLDCLTIITVGDVNKDGLVNTKDASMLSRSFVGKETLGTAARLAADTDADGVLTGKDTALLSQYLVGKAKLKVA